MPQAAGLFKRAIMQSGVCLPSIDSLKTQNEASRFSASWIKGLGLTASTLRTIDVEL